MTKIVLVILSLFGFFTFDSVYLFSVLNYVAQAEMNVHLLRDLRQLLLAKKYDDVDGAMKVCCDILHGTFSVFPLSFMTTLRWLHVIFAGTNI